VTCIIRCEPRKSPRTLPLGSQRGAELPAKAEPLGAPGGRKPIAAPLVGDRPRATPSATDWLFYVLDANRRLTVRHVTQPQGIEREGKAWPVHKAQVDHQPADGQQTHPGARGGREQRAMGGGSAPSPHGCEGPFVAPRVVQPPAAKKRLLA